jgi:hypothetical protein
MGREGMTLLEVIPSRTALRSIENLGRSLKGDLEQFFLTKAASSST